jgi:hypothetical protein
MEERISFELYKSAICHEVKSKGDLQFIKDTLISDEINKLFQKKWYPECLYLLAMFDYLSKENNIPLYNNYNSIRNTKLDEIVYPVGIVLLSYIYENDEPKRRSISESIPEFLKYNIVEAEIRNVC